MYRTPKASAHDLASWCSTSWLQLTFQLSSWVSDAFGPLSVQSSKHPHKERSVSRWAVYSLPKYSLSHFSGTEWRYTKSVWLRTNGKWLEEQTSTLCLSNEDSEVSRGRIALLEQLDQNSVFRMCSMFFQTCRAIRPGFKQTKQLLKHSYSSKFSVQCLPCNSFQPLIWVETFHSWQSCLWNLLICWHNIFNLHSTKAMHHLISCPTLPSNIFW